MISRQMDARSCSMHVLSFAMSGHVTRLNAMQENVARFNQLHSGHNEREQIGLERYSLVRIIWPLVHSAYGLYGSACTPLAQVVLSPDFAVGPGTEFKLTP